jgi:hypothetical protein
LLEEVTLGIAEMKVDNKKVSVTAVNVFGGGETFLPQNGQLFEVVQLIELGFTVNEFQSIHQLNNSLTEYICF